jgi:hypothetical protein
VPGLSKSGIVADAIDERELKQAEGGQSHVQFVWDSINKLLECATDGVNKLLSQINYSRVELSTFIHFIQLAGSRSEH